MDYDLVVLSGCHRIVEGPPVCLVCSRSSDDLRGIFAALSAVSLLQRINVFHVNERDRLLAINENAIRRLWSVDLRDDAAVSDALRLHGDLRSSILHALRCISTRTLEAADPLCNFRARSGAALGDLVFADEIRNTLWRSDI